MVQTRSLNWMQRAARAVQADHRRVIPGRRGTLDGYDSYTVRQWTVLFHGGHMSAEHNDHFWLSDAETAALYDDPVHVFQALRDLRLFEMTPHNVQLLAARAPDPATRLALQAVTGYGLTPGQPYPRHGHTVHRRFAWPIMEIYTEGYLTEANRTGDVPAVVRLATVLQNHVERLGFDGWIFPGLNVLRTDRRWPHHIVEFHSEIMLWHAFRQRKIISGERTPPRWPRAAHTYRPAVFDLQSWRVVGDA